MKKNTRFLNIFRSVLRMTNALDKNSKESQKTHFIFNNFFSKNRVFVR